MRIWTLLHAPMINIGRRRPVNRRGRFTPTHEFCCGKVVLQVTSDDNGVYLNVTGSGSNPTWFNRAFNLGGSLVFPEWQAPGISYRIDYSYYQQTACWPLGSRIAPPGSPLVPRF
jgi:hypothetical protein